MTLPIGGAANIPLVRKSFNKFVALGEKQSSANFRMTVSGYPDLEFLCKSISLPPLKREMMEITGPLGVQVQQQGKPINAHEVPVTFIETVNGRVMAALKDWVLNKRYLTVVVEALSEAAKAALISVSAGAVLGPVAVGASGSIGGGEGPPPVVMEYCWIESDAIENSIEDSATPLNIAGTIHCNWVYFA